MPRLPRPTLVRYLLEDRFLAVTSAVLSLVVLLPLLQTEMLPIVDLPIHQALVSQLNRLLAGDPMADAHFMLQPHPSPYWVLYLLLWASCSLLGTFTGAKLVVAFSLLVVPYGFIRLAGALGRSPRIGLWAFALCWDFNQSMGFTAFTITLGLAFFFVARALDALNKATLSRKWWTQTVLLGFLLANSHAHAAGTASALVGTLALAELPDWKRFRKLFGLSTVPTLSLLPWLVVSTLHKTGTERDPMAEHVGSWPSAGIRVGQLYHYTTNIVDDPLAQWIAGGTFLLLLILPLLYALNTGFGKATRQALALYLGMWLLYLVFPDVLFRPFYQWFINTRHATPMLLMGLLLTSRRFRKREAWLLAPGIAAAIAFSLTISWQFARFKQEVAPFQKIVERVNPNSRINWVLWENSTPESVLRSITSLPAYLITEKGGYSPHLFQSPNLPVVYRDSAHLEFVPWFEPQNFDPIKHGRGYDYVLLQGLSPEEAENARLRKEGKPIRRVRRRRRLPKGVLARGEGLEVRQIEASSIWRLYEVRELQE